MTTYQLTVSPDFSPDHISGWFIFNTWLQKQLDQHIHLELYDHFASQRVAIAADKIDLIYANPFDAAMLVREKGFIGIARPRGKVDEAIIAVNSEAAAHCVEDLKPGITVASTDDPDVRMMGMIMLEPADIGNHNIQFKACETYVIVAKELLRGGADAGLFLKQAYDDMSAVIRKGLRPLVTSDIQVVQHMLMVGPRMAGHADALRKTLSEMAAEPKGVNVLADLGFAGWELVDEEEVEFMIDLMDTLAS
ncbi:MAG: PhnD/SsuA/transferrin family substrate-binding protein [Betaproteobacteria bacterium]|nr:PhnD/SsuA/transferrin family substrate-binding protein [Betaproteobacteria bacterium]